MLRFARRVIGGLKGNKQDEDYVKDVLQQRRFLKDKRFWGFIIASNVLPLAYVYFAKTKAGNQKIFERSRVNALWRKYLAENQFQPFLQEKIDKYLLGEEIQLIQGQKEEGGKKESVQVIKSVKERIMDVQEIKIQINDQLAIQSPISGTVLNFCQIFEDGIEVRPGLKMSLKQLLTDDRYEPYTPQDLEELKLHEKKEKSEIFALTLQKNDILTTNYFSPVDFEVKNVIHYIGTLGQLPEIFKSKIGEKEQFYDKVETLNDIFLRQKVGYFGSSPYGIFTLVNIYEDLPFSTQEDIYQMLEDEDFKYNDQRILLRKMDKQKHIFQNQGNKLGNFGLGNGLVFLMFELPKNEFDVKFKIGDEVSAGQILLKKKNTK